MVYWTRILFSSRYQDRISLTWLTVQTQLANHRLQNVFRLLDLFSSQIRWQWMYIFNNEILQGQVKRYCEDKHTEWLVDHSASVQICSGIWSWKSNKTFDGKFIFWLGDIIFQLELFIYITIVILSRTLNWAAEASKL